MSSFYQRFVNKGVSRVQSLSGHDTNSVADSLALIRGGNAFIFFLPLLGIVLLVIDIFQFSWPVILIDIFALALFFISALLTWFEQLNWARGLGLVNATLIIFFSNDSLGNESLTHFTYIIPILLGSFILVDPPKLVSLVFTSIALAAWYFQLAVGTGIFLKPTQFEPYYPYTCVAASSLVTLWFFKKIQGHLKLVRAELRMKEKEVINSSKLAALGEMAAGIAHEINNPLMAIEGRVHLMKKDFTKGDTSNLIEGFDKVSRTIDRISKIVKGLRDFSREGSEDPMRNSKISEIVAMTLDLCQERFTQSQIELKIDLQNDREVFCREIQICQVLLNLLNNAYDVIEILPTKWVSISTSLYSAQDKIQFVDIKVTDSGLGISPEVADKMMAPFFTTKEVGKGTGLGLSISLGIIAKHGGSLFYDQTAANTTFVIRLPVQVLVDQG